METEAPDITVITATLTRPGASKSLGKYQVGLPPDYLKYLGDRAAVATAVLQVVSRNVVGDQPREGDVWELDHDLGRFVVQVRWERLPS